MATTTEAARKKLVDDFKALTADTEELLRATANQTSEQVSTARARVQERLREAKTAVDELRDTSQNRYYKWH